jgi:DNA polymerase III delta prime subunit
MEYNFKTLDELISSVEQYRSRRKRKRAVTTYGLREVRCAPEEIEIPYNQDMERLSDCIKPLRKLNNLVGMDDLKKDIINQILFYSQELNTNEMMHTCLMGPPGVGKTTLGKILSELYCSLGFLKSEKFTVVTSADLIAGYIGQTAIKTKKVLNNSLGGVLFLDEAYSIGTGDSEYTGYSKECADTINAFLSEHTSNFIMIIAGYQKDLDKCFFSLNQGLRRRFPWIYDIKKYSIENLVDIFKYQVSDNYWYFGDCVTTESLKSIFQEHSGIFEHNGGDTLVLFDKAKICHSRRVFGKKWKFKKTLILPDIRHGAELLKFHKNRVDPDKREIPFGMYT